MPSPSVIFASSFVPPEWIEAHGLRPSRVAPCAAGAVEREGLCPFAGAFAAAAGGPDVAAAVFTTTCDQMRRAAEIGGRGGGAPRFVMHVPSTWQTPGAHRLYREELGRLGRFLVRLGGHAPAPGELAACMERREAMRDEILARRPRLTSRAHGDLAARFLATGELSPGTGGAPGPAMPLMLLGGPLRAEDLDLLDAIDRAGARVAVDGTESGEREWPRRFDRRRLREDPAGELADAYFGDIPAVFRRPNSGLFDWLAGALHDTPVRGIVVVTHPWCDVWRAEVPRIRDASPVPVLALDLAGAGASAGAWSTRIEAFLEALR